MNNCELNVDFKKLVLILLNRSSFATIANIKGLKFKIYPKEKGHNEPHFHVSYQGREISISLISFKILNGNITHKQEKQAISWASENINTLRKSWNTYHEFNF